jgi:putative ABC transport system permease protein
VNFDLSLRMAVTRLIRFRGQTALMSSGIVICLCATVLVAIGLVNFRDRFEANLNRIYPVNSIELLSNYEPGAGLGGAPRLKATDVAVIPASVSEVVEWDPMVFAGKKIIMVGGRAVTTTVIGNSDRAEHVRSRSVSEGAYYSAADVHSNAKVALIGASVAAVLFPTESPIGEQIVIDGVSLRIVGLLEKVGLDPHGEDQDNVVQVPYTTLMQYVMKVDYISSATFVMADGDKTLPGARRVSDRMHELIGRDAADGQDFRIVTAMDMQYRLNQSFSTIGRFVVIAAVAGFGLSAIVIWIVMLMSVKARTSEIGLRKAVGASSGNVRTQIMLEAGILAACAAVLGLLLVEIIMLITAPMLRANLGLVLAKVPMLPIGLAVAGTFLAAILGAVVPARRAAALDPVLSLRRT